MFPRTEQATTLAATTGQQGDTTTTTFTKGTIRSHIGKQFQETDETNEASAEDEKKSKRSLEKN